jgi:hypothetical protein
MVAKITRVKMDPRTRKFFRNDPRWWPLIKSIYKNLNIIRDSQARMMEICERGIKKT